MECTPHNPAGAAARTHPSRRPVSFTDLPPELRNRIYELSLYHHENGGYIAPVGEPDVVRELIRTRVQGHDSVVQIISAPHHQLSKAENPARRHYAGPNDPLAQAIECSDALDGDYGSTRYTMAHICTAACLLQPALTRLDRQTRAETLPVFYGINRFDLQVGRCVKDGLAMAKKWWRAVGDHNLVLIRHFSVGQDYYSGVFRRIFAWKRSYHMSDFSDARYSVDFDDAGATTTLTLVCEWRGNHQYYTSEYTEALPAWARCYHLIHGFPEGSGLLASAERVEREGLSGDMLDRIAGPLTLKNSWTREVEPGWKAADGAQSGRRRTQKRKRASDIYP